MKKFGTVKLKVLASSVAAATLVLASSATAETIYLKCGQSTEFIVVDLEKHTVNGKPADITPVAIDWHNINNIADVHMHINRTTGVMDTTAVFTSQHNRLANLEPQTCSAVTPPAAKF